MSSRAGYHPLRDLLGPGFVPVVKKDAGQHNKAGRDLARKANGHPWETFSHGLCYACTASGCNQLVCVGMQPGDWDAERITFCALEAPCEHDRQERANLPTLERNGRVMDKQLGGVAGARAAAWPGINQASSEVQQRLWQRDVDPVRSVLKLGEEECAADASQRLLLPGSIQFAGWAGDGILVVQFRQQDVEVYLDLRNDGGSQVVYGDTTGDLATEDTRGEHKLLTTAFVMHSPHVVAAPESHGAPCPPFVLFYAHHSSRTGAALRRGWDTFFIAAHLLLVQHPNRWPNLPRQRPPYPLAVLVDHAGATINAISSASNGMHEGAYCSAVAEVVHAHHADPARLAAELGKVAPTLVFARHFHLAQASIQLPKRSTLCKSLAAKDKAYWGYWHFQLCGRLMALPQYRGPGAYPQLRLYCQGVACLLASPNHPIGRLCCHGLAMVSVGVEADTKTAGGRVPQFVLTLPGAPPHALGSVLKVRVYDAHGAVVEAEEYDLEGDGTAAATAQAEAIQAVADACDVAAGDGASGARTVPDLPGAPATVAWDVGDIPSGGVSFTVSGH